MWKKISFGLILSFSGIVSAQSFNSSTIQQQVLLCDSLLFDIGFNRCELAIFDSLLSPDFEFYHDKSGFSDKATFLNELKKGLSANQETYQSKRILQPGSTIITPLYDNKSLYAVIQEGKHLFYERIAAGEEKFAGMARFTHLWLLSNGKWQLKRSLSFDHRSAGELLPDFTPNNATLMRIGDSLLHHSENAAIWNLVELHPDEIFTFDHFFTQTDRPSKIALIQGTAGGSSGTADNLLIVFDPSSTNSLYEISWAGQVGDFAPTDIMDLTNDGIQEIVLRSGYTWMGETSENFEIINFKSNQITTLFSDKSIVYNDIEERLKLNRLTMGDTLEIQKEHFLKLNPDRSYYLEQKTTVYTFNGGKTVRDIYHKRKESISINTFQLH